MCKRENKSKAIYYTDELTDDFAGVERKTVNIDADFKFIRNGVLWRTVAFAAYRILMTPVAYLYCKLFLGLKKVNNTRVPIKKCGGCFLYSNHTLLTGDAFLPTVMMFPKKVYPIVNPENISTVGTKNFLLMCGAIPIPQSPSAFKGFLGAVDERVRQGHCVSVYPEAHIWRYYTGIRPFENKSFRFPVKSDAPVYVSTTTFHKRRFLKSPRITVYLEGPLYPDTSLPPKEAQKKLRDEVYEIMCRNSQNSTYAFYKYIRKEQSE